MYYTFDDDVNVGDDVDDMVVLMMIVVLLMMMMMMMMRRRRRMVMIKVMMMMMMMMMWCEPAQSTCTRTFPKSHFVWKLKMKIAEVNCGDILFVRACTVEMHGHVTRTFLCRNLKGIGRTLIPGPAFCGSLRSRDAHGHVTRAILR